MATSKFVLTIPAGYASWLDRSDVRKKFLPIGRRRTSLPPSPNPWIAISPLVVAGVANFILTQLVPRAYGAKHEVTLGGHPIVTEVGPLAAIWAVEGALLLGILTVFLFAWRLVLAPEGARERDRDRLK